MLDRKANDERGCGDGAWGDEEGEVEGGGEGPMKLSNEKTNKFDRSRTPESDLFLKIGLVPTSLNLGVFCCIVCSVASALSASVSHRRTISSCPLLRLFLSLFFF